MKTTSGLFDILKEETVNMEIEGKEKKKLWVTRPDKANVVLGGSIMSRRGCCTSGTSNSSFHDQAILLFTAGEAAIACVSVTTDQQWRDFHCAHWQFFNEYFLVNK